jgi:3-hydroxyisobutyrate dehydrogenase-like beta-hydroxyacid dehydrogenase
MKIGFIGLGKMGLPVAENILNAGHDLTVYNRTPSKAASLKDAGASVASSPAEAATGDVVFTMPFSDDHMEEVMSGEGGILSEMKPGAIHVCMSTLSIVTADKITQAHAGAGHRYVAAPVMGRPEMAQAAKLFVLAGGEAKTIEAVQPIFDVIAQRTFVLGDRPSQANLIKLCINFMAASAINSMGESMALARKCGIDPDAYLEVFTGTIFPGVVYQTYGKIIAEKNYDSPGADLDLGIKDVGQLIEAATAETVPMPIASVLHNNFVMAKARGNEDKDWAVVAKVMAENAGIE